jgi:ferritin
VFQREQVRKEKRKQIMEIVKRTTDENKAITSEIQQMEAEISRLKDIHIVAPSASRKK